MLPNRNNVLMNDFWAKFFFSRLLGPHSHTWHTHVHYVACVENANQSEVSLTFRNNNPKIQKILSYRI